MKHPDVRIDLEGLQALIAALHGRGYEVIGPAVHDGALRYQPVAEVKDLPRGLTAEQSPGRYALKDRRDQNIFSYAAGPNSLKDFLHAPEMKIFDAEKDHGPFRILPNTEPAPRYAFLGVRACDLAAVAVQDRVFLEDLYRDDFYASRRRNAFIVAVHCAEPASTCFCASFASGPRALKGFDLALTEFAGGEFLVEIGSDAGIEVLDDVPFSPASERMREQSMAMTREAAARMSTLDVAGLRELLRDNFESPVWDEIAARCLACGNCTLACPTCFCVTFEDASDFSGSHAARWRRWDSCFTLGFSYIHGGSVRLSTKSRYRQWLTHKLSYWFDQFSASGCVGCGRCITWCPAGIDLRREIAAIRAAAHIKEAEKEKI